MIKCPVTVNMTVFSCFGKCGPGWSGFAISGKCSVSLRMQELS